MSIPVIKAQFPTPNLELSLGLISVTVLAPAATVATRELCLLSWMTPLPPRKNPLPLPLLSVKVAPYPITRSFLIPRANELPEPVALLNVQMLPLGIVRVTGPRCALAHKLNAVNAALSFAIPSHLARKSVTIFLAMAVASAGAGTGPGPVPPAALPRDRAVGELGGAACAMVCRTGAMLITHTIESRSFLIPLVLCEASELFEIWAMAGT